jgi:hypothetical protein
MVGHICANNSGLSSIVHYALEGSIRPRSGRLSSIGDSIAAFSLH